MRRFGGVTAVYRHVCKQLAAQIVVCRFGMRACLHDLLHAHTVVVILEGERLPFAGHFLELATNRPFVRPATIIQRVTDCVISNGGSVIRRQIVLPIIDNGRLSEKLRKQLCAMHIAAGSAFIAHL